MRTRWGEKASGRTTGAATDQGVREACGDETLTLVVTLLLTNGGGATLGVVHVTLFAGVATDRLATWGTCGLVGFVALEDLGQCLSGLGGDCVGNGREGVPTMADVAAMAWAAIAAAEEGTSRKLMPGVSVRRPLHGCGDNWTRVGGDIAITRVFLRGDVGRMGEGDVAWPLGVCGTFTTLITVPCRPCA